MGQPQKGTNKKVVSGKGNNLQTSPKNEEFKLYSLRNFCLEHNLNDSALQRVAKGEIKQYKGWKCKYETVLLT